MSDVTEGEYSQFVKSRIKPADDIISSLTAGRANALHMAVGISGEAGELLDSIKKFVIYNKGINLMNVIEELGDLEFYMEGLRAEFGLSRQQIINHNKAKLSERYKEKFTDEEAQNRVDKSKGF